MNIELLQKLQPCFGKFSIARKDANYDFVESALRTAFSRDKDIEKDTQIISELRNRLDLTGAQLAALFRGNDPTTIGETQNPFVDELVHKANEEIRDFVSKVISGEIILTDDKLQECVGYIKRKLVLAQLSLSVEINTITDIEVANLVKIQSQSIKTQIDSLETTMKMLLADNKGDDLGLEEEASEV